MAYVAFPAGVEDIRLAFAGLFAAGVRGLNVTMPFKGEAYEYAGARHGETAYFKAANTLVCREGLVHAYNTDLGGFVKSFAMGTGRTFQGLNVMILGAGASCRALAYAVADASAGSVAIVSRTASRSEAIMAQYEKIFEKCNFFKTTYSDGAIYDIMARSDVVINTTPAGMRAVPDGESGGADAMPGGIVLPFSSSQCAVDLIYSPKETFFLRSARMAGATAINGLGMLVCQAALSFEYFTGATVGEDLLSGTLAAFRAYV
jgi:shikimate dehydrogenase